MHTWGPNKKNKEVTIQVDKSSNGELKHVDILATKVVKPLLDKLLAGETVKNIVKNYFGDTVKHKENHMDEKYRCPECGKQYKGEQTMKSHIAKMHTVIKQEQCTNNIQAAKEQIQSSGTDSESDKCAYKCDECNFKTINKTKFKKHIKKTHRNSGSNSPARKKPKVTSDVVSKAMVEEILNRIHDTGETEEDMDKELVKLETTSFEEQRIDEQLMDANTEKMLSDRNDRKILEKQKIADENEAAKDKDIKRNMLLLKSKECTKRKRETSIRIKGVKNAKLSSGFKEIPSHLRKHFPEDHVIQKIKAD